MRQSKSTRLMPRPQSPEFWLARTPVDGRQCTNMGERVLFIMFAWSIYGTGCLRSTYAVIRSLNSFLPV